MKKLLIVLCLVAAPAMAQDDPILIRRPTDRVVATRSSPECVYVESIWGAPCSVDCKLDYTPLWFGDNRVMYFKLMTNKNAYGPTESSHDFTGTNSGQELSVTWGDDLKWVEWWVRDPDGEYGEVPLKGCYCNDLTGVVTVCFKGVRDE